MSGHQINPPFAWREHLQVHPAADLFPLLSEAELKELADDLLAHGQRMLIMLCKSPDGTRLNVLDGRNRLDAMALTGRLRADDDGELYFGDEMVGLIGVKSDPYETVVSLNLHRRHLTSEQKRDLIAKLLKAKPERSNRAIADAVKVDHKTVGSVRAEKEATGEIPQLEKTTGKDGKARKQPKARKMPARGSVEYERDKAECIALYQKTRAAERESETVSAKDSAQQEFDGHVLRLLQMTTGAKRWRFSKTSVPVAKLNELGRFLIDTAGEIEDAQGRAPSLLGAAP